MIRIYLLNYIRGRLIMETLRRLLIWILRLLSAESEETEPPKPTVEICVYAGYDSQDNHRFYPGKTSELIEGDGIRKVTVLVARDGKNNPTLIVMVVGPQPMEGRSSVNYLHKGLADVYCNQHHASVILSSSGGCFCQRKERDSGTIIEFYGYSYDLGRCFSGPGDPRLDWFQEVLGLPVYFDPDR